MLSTPGISSRALDDRYLANSGFVEQIYRSSSVSILGVKVAKVSAFGHYCHMQEGGNI